LAQRATTFTLFTQATTTRKIRPYLRYIKNYIDIQYIVSGRETFGWKPKMEFPEQLYNPEKDCALFTEEDYGTFTLGAGEFAIFYPTDAHAPKMKNAGGGKIEKIVVKVRVY
jgi:YhcH/YjgK/YiaL family protein